MSEQFYLEDSDISNEIFDGEPVPGENSISKSKNLMLKRKVRDLINGLMNVPVGQVMADTYALLKQYSLILYKRVLDDDKAAPIRDEDKSMIALIARRYKKPALYHFKPSDL